jgi:hypothetical protein
MLCKNPLGRLEFNQNRVRNHFFETITRLEAEKKQEEFCKINSENNFNDLSIIACILSTIISQIEHDEYEISSILHSIISSVDDSILKESSSHPTIILSLNTKTNTSNSIPSSSKENSVQTQRICHTKSSIKRKMMTSTSSIKIISTELS